MNVTCLNAARKRLELPKGIAVTAERRKKLCHRAGFTLVELIVVTAIIGVLVMLTIPAYNHFVNKVKMTRATTEIRGLEKDILANIVDKNTLPNSLSDIGRGSLLDPWGKPYQYSTVVARLDPLGIDTLNTDFDLYSRGPDDSSAAGINDPSSLDDIVRAGNGGWVGRGEDF